MTSELISQLVESEIKISELGSLILARDSHILSLETEIQALRFEISKLKKVPKATACCQTDFYTRSQEEYTQTLQHYAKADSSVQTTQVFTEEISEIQDDGELNQFSIRAEEGLADPVDIDKENKLKLTKESSPLTIPNEIPPKPTKDFCSSQAFSFIAALNLKSDLPLSSIRPKPSSNAPKPSPVYYI